MSKKLSVCITSLAYYPSWGGVARSASRLVKGLVQAGYCVSVVVPSKEAKSEGKHFTHLLDVLNNFEVDENGAHIYRVPIGLAGGMMGHLIEFIQLLDYQKKFDIFHGFWLSLAYPSLVVAAKGSRPVIASIRGNDALRLLGTPSEVVFIREVLGNADWITSVSSDLLVNVSALVDVGNKSSVIINGIDSSDLPQWTFDNCKAGLVGTAGELRFKKGTPLLVNAYAEVDPEIRSGLLLIGTYSGEFERDFVLEMIDKLGIASECVHTGLLDRDRLLKKMTELNVFVISSLHDGLPNGLLEAAACGIPIVATDVGGMSDVLTSGENCLLVPPGSIHDLSLAISRLLDDELLCRKLSVGAKALAKTLNHKQESDDWLSLYEKFH